MDFMVSSSKIFAYISHKCSKLFIFLLNQATSYKLHKIDWGQKNIQGENYFMEFIAKHRGSTNAYTCGDKTVYFCSVEHECYEKLVDALIKQNPFR